MIPDEPARGASPSQRPSDGDVPSAADQGSRGRTLLMILAVTLAAAGLLALAAVLLTAFLGQDVWPGFILATYVCLPISFLLMISLVVWSVVARRRA